MIEPIEISSLGAIKDKNPRFFFHGTMEECMKEYISKHGEPTLPIYYKKSGRRGEEVTMVFLQPMDEWTR